jgi:transposase InsO family protein
MPWKEKSPMSEKMRFVLDCAEGLFGMRELAERYGISRKTAYKWLERFEEEGAGGLEDRPAVAERVANRTAPEVERLIVLVRQGHATWGPKKLLSYLEKREPEVKLPARSTVAEILKRSGLVQARRRRRREGHPGRPSGQANWPNEIWGADFKGQFRTRDGRYCYPFTVTDLFSRYLITCDGQLSTALEPVKRALERAFREHGLPEAIRTDNGAPFASTGIARLTRLGVWLLKLGIRRELIEPGRPDQNGCHERMHRTLKQETTRPAESNLARQRRRFDAFRKEFNDERPHEGLGMKRPSEVYRASPRPFPERLDSPTYPGHFEVRRVSRNGGVRWKGDWLNVGHSLVEENVGFDEVGDGIWDAHFGPLLIGRFDERELRLVGTLATHYRCGKRGNRRTREGLR